MEKKTVYVRLLIANKTDSDRQKKVIERGM